MQSSISATAADVSDAAFRFIIIIYLYLLFFSFYPVL